MPVARDVDYFVFMRDKGDIRDSVWKSLETNKVSRFPGAAGRIPNFIGAEACAKQLAETIYWKAARVIKINPDSPQRAIRQMALAEGKVIYMAVPRLRSEKPFIELDPGKLKSSPFAASSIKGAGLYGRPVTLAEVRKIDLVVCGSVAVNRQGARVGKGGGYSDLEFALLTQENKLAGATPIVTSVHALQLIDEEIPMTAHDIPLSAIVTPTEVIAVKTPFARPKRIYWSMLAREKIDAIPVLKRLRS